jgi:methyl-accepting chemotaxis protein/hemoglobin-like flavoprotein
LAAKIQAFTIPFLLAGMGGLAYWLADGMRSDLQARLRDRGIVIQKQIEVMRGYLASQYVAKIKSAGQGTMKVGQDHSAPDTVPLPATATREMSEQMSQLGLYTARVISRTPLNPANSPQGAFEEEAIRALEAGATESIRLEPVKGVMMFRRMTPDVISSQACIGCHTDKKMGDMVGAVSVQIPIEKLLLDVEQKVRVLYAVGAIGAVILATILFLLLRSLVILPLKHLGEALQQIAQGQYATRAAVTAQDEVGQLAQSFNEMGEQLETKVTKEREQMAAMEQFMMEAKRVLEALAQGDLTDHMTSAYEGAFDQMKTSLNMAIRKLTATLTTVRTAAESVAAGTEEITQGNEDLLQRASEQAASLEETSSAMEEMTSTVKQNADNAKQANQLAIAARDVANKGGAVTTKAVEAMGEINQSSKKIADIITVIDEIAFQTNLLALNAAVEAARAGEHGRGFAVVAAEVRNLAQRSATAAKEIKGLIHESIQRVTDGSELVNQSGKTLDEIVGSVMRVTGIIAEITAASQEQASGIDQVNKAIMQMDKTTQQNAALVEEATLASQSMKDQAQALMRQVGCFKMSDTHDASGTGTTYASRDTRRASPKPLSNNPAAPAISGDKGAHHAVTTSFGRCSLNPKFLDRFYDIFLKSHPAIAPMFKHTDFARQKSLLKQGLTMMLMFADGSASATASLKKIAESHSPAGRWNIPHQLYPYWMNSLLAAVKECDTDFTSSLEAEWRAVLESGVNYIITEGDRYALAQPAAGMASGNGKDRRTKDSEFEEF